MDLTNDCGCPYGNCTCDSYAPPYVYSKEEVSALAQSIALSKRRGVAKSYKGRVVLEQVCDCGHSLQRHGVWRERTKRFAERGKKHANGGKCNWLDGCSCIKFSQSQIGRIDMIESQDSMELTIRCGMVLIVVDLETGIWACAEDAMSGTRPSELCLYLRGW